MLHIYIYLYKQPFSLSSFYSLFLTVWLRCWVEVLKSSWIVFIINNTVTHTSSICWQQTIEILPVHPVTHNTHCKKKNCDKLTSMRHLSSFKVFDHMTIELITSRECFQLSMYTLTWFQESWQPFLLELEGQSTPTAKITHHRNSNNTGPASNPCGDVKIPLYYSA